MNNSNDIVEQAAQLVENHIALLEAVCEANKALADARSNRVCRCPSCKNQREMTLSWVDSMLE